MMANWCAMTGFPPDVYQSLSLIEAEEMYKAAKRLNPYVK